MTDTFDAVTADLRYTDLPAEKCPAGAIATGVTMLASTDALEVGVWEHPVGTSTDVETDEVFVVLSGRGRVTLDDGRVLELSPGVVGVLSAGTATTWEIDEALRKVWVVER
ncbi:MAG: cupin domain-containing protein [Actinobacteria bacterium]|nr:cupin domain-containing protein [Actinomycetota bacterium]